VLEGWAVTKDSELWKTADGGRNWTLFSKLEYEGSPLELRPIKSVDGIEGWGASFDGLWHTQDGGRTWLKAQFPRSVDQVCFRDKNTGWILANTGGSGTLNAVYRTVDGGTTWEKTEIPDTEWDDPHDLFFLDERQGWLSNDSGIYHSKDGGATWEKQQLPEEAKRRDELSVESGMVMDSIHFINELEGWAAGDRRRGAYAPTKPVLLHTTDGGESWKEIHTRLSGYSLGPVFFGDPQNGWLVGGETVKKEDEEQQFDPATIIYHTTDGGKSWKSVLTLPDPGRFVEMRDSGKAPH
jgi:photosystem II stability/assembly factor-like uncharacterized protein